MAIPPKGWDFPDMGFHVLLDDKAGLFDMLKKPIGKPVPTPKHRKILKIGEGAVLHFNPNTAASETTKVHSTWCLDSEWMHMSNEFAGAKIDTDYDITSHTATLMIRLPVEFMDMQDTAGQFMADAHNIMENAESASDFFAAMAIAWSKIENGD